MRTTNTTNHTISSSSHPTITKTPLNRTPKMEDIEMEGIHQDYLTAPSNVLAERPNSLQERNESPVDPILEPCNSRGLHQTNKDLHTMDSIDAQANDLGEPRFHSWNSEENVDFESEEDIENMGVQYDDVQYDGVQYGDVQYNNAEYDDVNNEDVDNGPEDAEDEDAEEEDFEEEEEENEAGWTTRAGRRFTLYKEEIGYNRPKDHHELDEYMRSITGAREVINRVTTFMPGHYTLKNSTEFVESSLAAPLVTLPPPPRPLGVPKHVDVLGMGMEYPRSQPRFKPEISKEKTSMAAVDHDKLSNKSSSGFKSKIFKRFWRQKGEEPIPEVEPLPELNIVHTSHLESQDALRNALDHPNPRAGLEEWKPRYFEKHDAERRALAQEQGLSIIGFVESPTHSLEFNVLSKSARSKPLVWHQPGELMPGEIRHPIPVSRPHVEPSQSSSEVGTDSGHEATDSGRNSISTGVEVPCRLDNNPFPVYSQSTNNLVTSESNSCHQPQRPQSCSKLRKCWNNSPSSLFSARKASVFSARKASVDHQNGQIHDTPASREDIFQSPQEFDDDSEEENPPPIFIRPGWYQRGWTQEELFEETRRVEIERIAKYGTPYKNSGKIKARPKKSSPSNSARMSSEHREHFWGSRRTSDQSDDEHTKFSSFPSRWSGESREKDRWSPVSHLGRLAGNASGFFSRVLPGNRATRSESPGSSTITVGMNYYQDYRSPAGRPTATHRHTYPVYNAKKALKNAYEKLPIGAVGKQKRAQRRREKLEEKIGREILV
ncbi:hypothetical protein DFH27DRAFT_603676 [Peziza echinospora]|nr:hypothetical protein DFH27DRAFT_603676 [Peziza echinospora]